MKSLFLTVLVSTFANGQSPFATKPIEVKPAAVKPSEAKPITAKQKNEADPNGYFRDREWTLKVNKNAKIHIVSKYKGEPIMNPNRFNAHVLCPKGKKVLAIEDFYYCGVDSVSIVNGNLEMWVIDYNSNDPKGYCSMKKRLEIFQIPSC